METARPAESEDFIGLTGFEPATFRTRGERSTKLSHSPNCASRENFKRRTPYLAHFGGSSKLYRAPILQKVCKIGSMDDAEVALLDAVTVAIRPLHIREPVRGLI